MPGSFSRSPAAPPVPPVSTAPPGFTCRGCAGTDFDTVAVVRLDGSRYTTEFVACLGCRAMYWRPDLAGAPRAPDLRRLWPAADPPESPGKSAPAVVARRRR